MGLFNRKPRITSLLVQIRHIEAELQRVIADEGYIPSPRQFYSLEDICEALPHIYLLAHNARRLCNERIITWQNTPYTPAQQFRRNIIAFMGWWFAGTMTLWQTILGWFTPFFPEPWYALATSGAIALVIVAMIAVCEQQHR